MPNFVFNLAPEGQLTFDQNRAWQDPNPVLVTGGPGTGKTVVSIYRFLSSLVQTQNSLFFTYNRTLMMSIKGLLIQRGDDLLGNIDDAERMELINNSVRSMYEWYGQSTHGRFDTDDAATIATKIHEYIQTKREGIKYNDVHIDEAQDMMPRIIQSMGELGDKVNCGADRAQDLQGNFDTAADVLILEILNTFRPTENRPLSRNFRNTKQIFDFARTFALGDPRVAHFPLDMLDEGEYPEVFGGLNEAQQLDKIWDIVNGNQSNIGIIVFSEADVKRIRDFFRNVKKFTDFSYYYSNMPATDRINMEQQLKTPFIITYESCKGLEFETVIMPFFQKAAWMLQTPKKVDEVIQLNADGSVKTICTKSHFYVAATRARKFLYVFYDWETTIFNDFTRPVYKLNGRLRNLPN